MNHLSANYIKVERRKKKTAKEEKRLVTAFERRKAIMQILRLRKFEKVDNLAFQFSVTPRTIKRDVEMLSLTESIYTQQGRYGGGIYYENFGEKTTPTAQKIELLKKLKKYCTPEEIKTLRRIIQYYGA